MISALILVLTFYAKWYYKSFTDTYPAWIENSDNFVYAMIPEVGVEVALVLLFGGY